MSSTSFTTSFNDQLQDSDPLKKVRQKSWERFLEVGVPDSRTDAYQFVKLRELLSTSFSKAKPQDPDKSRYAFLPECQNSCIVFVNGYFRPDLSNTSALPKGSMLLPMQQSFKSFSALLNNRFAKFVKEETDAFALLNAAHFQEGAFLYVPPKVRMQAPLQILSVVDTPEAHSWVMPRMHLFIGASSEITLASCTEQLQGERALYNACLDLEIEENAKVKLSHIDLDKNPIHSFSFDAFRATLKRSSTLHGLVMSDSERSRRDFHIQLAGVGAECELSGVWFLDGHQETHSNVSIEHLEPHTRSMQLFKGVLEESASSSFQGKIKVLKKAQKTLAYQLNNNLVLSDKAQANSKPNLEIFADDVKASHGATVGQLDQEQLFYLKTRGLTQLQAKSMLIFGFCEEVLQRLPIESCRLLAEQRLRDYSERMQSS